MTVSIKSDAGGTFGSLQVAGNDVLRFGSDTSGQLYSFRNKIINGNFDIWQRGISITPALGTVFSADRWYVYSTGAAPASIGRGGGHAASTDFPYSLSVVGATSNTALTLGQRIESINAKTLAGKSVTVSGYIYSTDVRTVNVVTQYYGTVDTPASAVTIASNPVTTIAGSFKYFSITSTFPIQAQNGVELAFVFGTTLAGVNVALSGIQVEVGSIATPFEQRPIGLELSLCQRYYCKFFATAGGAYSTADPAQAAAPFTFPVQMRIAPQITAGALGVSDNLLSDSFVSTTVQNTGGTYLVTKGTAVGNFRGARFDSQASAEL